MKKKVPVNFNLGNLRNKSFFLLYLIDIGCLYLSEQTIIQAYKITNRIRTDDDLSIRFRRLPPQFPSSM
jgi:hypothetical protein